MPIPSETPPEVRPVLTEAELLERAAFAPLPMHQKRFFVPTVEPTLEDCPGSDKKPKTVTKVGKVITGGCEALCNNMFRFTAEKGWELPPPPQPAPTGR